jgi:predicted GIY-YIG superfamily endonuclease
VINLKKTVLDEKRFLNRSPDYRKGKPTVYVGQSSYSPRDRFEQHQAGIRSSWCVRRYGKSLRTDEGEVGLTRAEALEREASLASELRGRGWGVWAN